jgi:hypothetical protein
LLPHSHATKNILFTNTIIKNPSWKKEEFTSTYNFLCLFYVRSGTGTGNWQFS